MRDRVLPLPMWTDCERADIDDLVRVHAWRLGRERLSLRIGLSFDFRLGGSCSMVLSTGVDRVRLRALRRDQVRSLRLRAPPGRVVPLRVRPLTRCNGHSRPLLVRLVRRH